MGKAESAGIQHGLLLPRLSLRKLGRSVASPIVFAASVLLVSLTLYIFESRVCILRFTCRGQSEADFSDWTSSLEFTSQGPSLLRLSNVTVYW